MAKKDKIISEYKDYDDMINVLDKILELKKSEKKPNFVKRCLWITTCIAMLVVVATICFMIYKNSFSIESLISLLLAFFSIFISVFFYFKADDASNRFYETSYDFMKDVSVTLGKIEERFGEKLNNLNEKQMCIRDSHYTDLLHVSVHTVLPQNGFHLADSRKRQSGGAKQSENGQVYPRFTDKAAFRCHDGGFRRKR